MTYNIRPIDPHWIDLAKQRQLQLTKPPGSLGRLEDIANRIAAIRERFDITASHPRIVLFAADHGVCAEGVSAYPQEVTTQMVLNFLAGGAAINAFARAGQIDLKVVNMGVRGDLPESADLIDRRIAQGTANFCAEPAMTKSHLTAAIEAGIGLACDAVREGCDVLGFGEMGIGNTTAASAITAALSGQPVDAVTGPGAGADDACISRKRSAVERALRLHAAGLEDPLTLLQCLGGIRNRRDVRFLSWRCRSQNSRRRGWLHLFSRSGSRGAPFSRGLRLSVRFAPIG